jgi:hypothetical protein
VHDHWVLLLVLHGEPWFVTDFASHPVRRSTMLLLIARFYHLIDHGGYSYRTNVYEA